MRLTVISGIMSIAGILAVFTATVACATPSPTLLQTGKNTYAVQGSNLDKVAGIGFVINYDPTTMANPRVTQGSLSSEMLMVANTNQPGTMSVAFVNSYPNGKSGSGTIAEITFDSLKSSPGTINISRPQLFDVNGILIALDPSGGQLNVGGQTTDTTQTPNLTQTTITTQTTGVGQAQGGLARVPTGRNSEAKDKPGCREGTGREPTGPGSVIAVDGKESHYP